jgi:hypothetical protein
MKNKMQEQISIKEYPSIHWAKFFNRFDEITILPIESWDTTLLIAYFCKRYRDHYNISYTFKFNSNAPSKSIEVFRFRSLGMNLSASPVILKDYIDWVFDTKIIQQKRRITTMAILVDEKNVHEYKIKKQAMDKNVGIDRTTIIPANYAAIVKKHGFTFSSFGELSFIKKCIDSKTAEEGHKTMLDELSNNGLDLRSLDKVK